ncbi:MAG: HAMP domain-containing sensor histidine kinase [Phycisphaerales bacterium]
MRLDEDATIYLLSNFTHQVINPLNGVIGTIDNMLDGTVPPDKLSTRLSGVRGQLQCTVSLIRNLAFFAQYTADYAKIKQEKMDKICIIPQLVIEAPTFYQEQARQKNIAIELRERWNQFAVRGNPDLLRQVLMNIFDNGVKYGLPDTVIEIRDWIQKTTGDMIITVSGPSVGFKKDEDIFALGVRGEAAKHVLSSGTGIGLHVCRLIIENVFGGEIRGEHASKSGMTTFEIRLPGGFLNDPSTQ